MFAEYVNYLTLLSCFITGAVAERALGKVVRDQVRRLFSPRSSACWLRSSRSTARRTWL
jgi:hypothetical protein